jgi:hypothetical protein
MIKIVCQFDEQLDLINEDMVQAITQTKAGFLSM